MFLSSRKYLCDMYVDGDSKSHKIPYSELKQEIWYGAAAGAGR